MRFLLVFVFFAVCVFLSYYFLKAYQLEGYQIKSFLIKAFQPFKLNDKNRLVFTKRMTRFCVLLFIEILAVLLILSFFVKSLILFILLSVLIVMLIPIFVMVAHIIISPFEKIIKNHYIKKTKKKLECFKGKKIAVVGSFGKTSVKNFLYKFLSNKYKVNITPKNFNTPMGICKTVLENFDMQADYAIFEMGARHVGDIKELMEIVNPDIGIMTAVGEQHVESFGSIENVKIAKNELVKFIKNDGVVYFDCYNKNTEDLFNSCSKQKFCVGENGDAFLINTTLSKNGSEVECRLRREGFSFKTKLLGCFNLQNVLISALVAFDEGVQLKSIRSQISKLEPVKNRLELIERGNLVIIDDSYNSNFYGAMEALRVMNLFGGDKIVVTPGLVELGNLQYEKNFLLGKEIGRVATKVIIMNDVNKKAIFKGLEESKFNEKKIYYCNSREDQKKTLKRILGERCVVLFQNDLPDNYR